MFLPCPACLFTPALDGTKLLTKTVKVNGKFTLRTGHEGPDGGVENNSTLSLTSALDGVGSQGHVPAALPSGKTRYPLWGRHLSHNDKPKMFVVSERLHSSDQKKKNDWRLEGVKCKSWREAWLATVKFLGNAEVNAAVVITFGNIAGHLMAYYSSGQLA
jgi:hypothetical protein